MLSRNEKYCLLIIVQILLLSSISLSQDGTSKKDWLQSDIIGDMHYSLYNFTDAVIPYYGLDAWTEYKITCWVEPTHVIAPYFSLLGSYMWYLPSAPNNILPFYWQRYLQGALGLQWYPFFKNGAEYHPSFGIRIFAFGACRKYVNERYWELSYNELINYDFQGGADYYHDNILDDKKKLVLAAWSNATFRTTNFNRNNYNAFLWTGNVKIGRKWDLGHQAFFFPYVVLDWTTTFFSNSHLWWENYAHAGGGVQIYPIVFKKKDGLNERKVLNREIFRRFHIYSEIFWKGTWLRKQPPARVKNYDFRFGLGFSTPGFSRNKE